jgi:flagella basal body P-ring formation protein FlgA
MKRLFACLSLAWAVPLQAVTLNPEAVVTDTFVRLGDIAATERAELRELRIAYSPRPGASLVLERVDVERLLARLKPALAVQMQGAARVTVRRAPQGPGVSRHQPVVVRAASGAVSVETTAVATGDGRPGEIIRVRNTATHKTYPVRVAGPGVVEALWR